MIIVVLTFIFQLRVDQPAYGISETMTWALAKK